MTKRIFNIVLCCIISFALVIAFCPITAFAYSPSEFKQKEVDEVNSKIEKNKQELNDAVNRLNEATSKHDSTQKEKDEAQARWDGVKQEIDELRPQLEEDAKYSYVLIFVNGLLNELIGNEFISDSLFHWGLFMPFADEEQKRINGQVEYFYEEAKSYNKVVNAEKYAAEEQAKATTDKERLTKESCELKADLAKKTAELETIKDLEKRCGEAAAAYIAGHGYFAHPCPEGKMTSPFGEPRGTYYHKGIDFAAPEGTPIYCAADGVVVGHNDSDPDSGGRGLYVEVKHSDGLVTKYYHCFKLHVKTGDQVTKGQNIARVGNTGDSTGPHVHFQVELNGEPVDGMKYLEG